MDPQKFIAFVIWMILGILFLPACGNDSISEIVTPTVVATGLTPLPSETNTPIAPSTTDPDISFVATVNGQGITEEAFQTQLFQVQAISGTGLATYSEEDVLKNLIDEVLLAQGAAESGFVPDEAEIQMRITQLGVEAQALEDWRSKNGYTPESFEQALGRAIAAAWMRDQIIETVPSTAEQVHARQILLYNSDQAENIYNQLQTGSDFATLAAQNDPLTLGDLGWFPRGYLTVPELDDEIFSREPGEYTPVIQTALGFHIVQIVERDPQHPLSPGAFQFIKVQAIENWLTERRSQSEINIFLP
jgi:peptidyl-prolyl cis-trans isomerase C